MAYTYLIGWSKLDIWYYGVRFAPSAVPSDLWTKAKLKDPNRFERARKAGLASAVARKLARQGGASL